MKLTPFYMRFKGEAGETMFFLDSSVYMLDLEALRNKESELFAKKLKT